ncbi:hypothetical protein DF142_01275 [Burkholderia cenocepacia]|uniref:hypothetical protein n=1 Tax=Burkholderia cenocepacia TaxID=95486 RepID=UPI000F57D57A|nr:hypothetical protein [Burkholderia cenocepacia]RQU45958.1 hypothetical protein DF142_01275 [Burkholderia cenocepacia]RQU73561.1 hypothetical protein DF140_01275 [Burkholderia cenocepacia]RQU96388.1 hypothetical protein DF040_01640 [Burkholderia cenocepacia]
MKWLIDLNYIELPANAGMGLIRPLRDKISPGMVALQFVLVAASQMIWKSGAFRHGGSSAARTGSVHAIKPSIAHAF